MSEPPGSSPPVELSSEDRLDSWKEIAAYLKRDITTVQRWERREGMPVHRHVHDKVGSVYAFRTEVDAWVRRREGTSAADGQSRSTAEVPGGYANVVVEAARHDATPRGNGDPLVHATAPSRRLSVWRLVATGAALVVGLALWRLLHDDASAANPLTGARFQQLTDFGGAEHAAALSRDGRFVAFLSDRDGPMDVWVSQIGTGQHYNLTRGMHRNSSIPRFVRLVSRRTGHW